MKILSILPSPTTLLLHNSQICPSKCGTLFKFNPLIVSTTPTKQSIKFRECKTQKVNALISDVSTSVDPIQAQITWQIVVGALAGVIPFIVAGIEFSKRIVAQRECEVCKGSGLVLRDKKYYFKCPACGGFLPWQSWRRFFSG